MSNKKQVAVLFGGQSVEHDVSILTGLQFIEAMDQEQTQPVPVYIDPDGQWWTGEALLKRSFYPLTKAKQDKLTSLSFIIGGSKPGLYRTKKSLLSSGQELISIDTWVMAIHGTGGEDGGLQGLMEFAGLAFTGCSAEASAITMDKAITKDILAQAGVHVLPHALLVRNQTTASKETIMAAIKKDLGSVTFPLIVKPRRLGSSVGVVRAENEQDLLGAVLSGFRLDNAVIVEPMVANLIEYNIAARRDGNGYALSAIETPLAETEVLDFRNKYLRGGSGGAKMDDAPSEGMASLNREINPESLSQKQADLIRAHAMVAAETLELAGSCRIDFLSDRESGEIWLNEINTIPGSFAFYLWQAAEPRLSFTELTNHMIEEAILMAEDRKRDTSVTLGGSVIFERD